MGFMKGFGQSFSTSFENANTRRATKERDALTMAYETFTRNSTKWDEDKRADEALIQSAKFLVEQAGLPEEAWGEAYKRMKAGFSAEKTDEWLRTNKFSAPAATEAPTEAQAPSTVDGQMEQLGQVENPAIANSPTVEQPEGGLLHDTAAQATQPEAGRPVAPEGMDEAMSTVAENTGTSAEEMAQINAGYQSPELPPSMVIEAKMTDPLVEFGLEDGITAAKLAAAKVRADQYRNSDDPSLRASAERFDALAPSIEAALAENPAMDTMTLLEGLKVSADIRQPIREQTAAVTTMANIGMEMDAFAKANPEVITNVGAGAGAVVGISNEVNALFNMIGEMGARGDSETAVQEAVKQWESQFLDDSTLAETASKQAQWAAMQVRFIYAAGKSMGQSGNGFSNYDYDNIMKSIKASNGYEAYSQNLRSFIGERVNDVQGSIDVALDSMELQTLSRDPTAKTMLMTELQSMDDRLDPAVIEWLNPTATVDPATTTAPGNVPSAETDTNVAPEGAVEVTPEMVELFPEVFTTEDVGKKFTHNKDNTVTVY